MATKKAVKPVAPTTKPLTAKQRLDAIGIEAICIRVAAGEKQSEICRDLKIDKAELSRWLALDDQRSAQAREAHVASAKHWDEQAESVLMGLKDESKPGGVARARELASHYRWRASKYAPKDYGEKVTQEHTGDGGGPLKHSISVVFVDPT